MRVRQGILDGLPVLGLALGDYTLFPLWVWIYCICWWFVQARAPPGFPRGRYPRLRGLRAPLRLCRSQGARRGSAPGPGAAPRVLPLSPSLLLLLLLRSPPLSSSSSSLLLLLLSPPPPPPLPLHPPPVPSRAVPIPFPSDARRTASRWPFSQSRDTTSSSPPSWCVPVRACVRACACACVWRPTSARATAPRAVARVRPCCRRARDRPPSPRTGPHRRRPPRP